MDGARLFTACPVTGPGAQTETQKAPSEHSVREWSSTGTGRPETCCGVSILGENQKPTGHNPGQPALGVPGGVGHRCFPQVPSVFLRYGNIEIMQILQWEDMQL